MESKILEKVLNNWIVVYIVKNCSHDIPRTTGRALGEDQNLGEQAPTAATYKQIIVAAT